MSIPITILHAGTKPQDLPLQYFVGANGVYLALQNNWVNAVVPVAESPKGMRDVCNIPGLEKVESKVKFLLPKIPYNLIAQIVGFFSEIERRMSTEVAVMLHYSPTKGWAVTAPNQQVTGGTVSYEMTDRIPGYRCVGTMHSHVRMSAFHSGVDVPDEAQFDGLHCTIGYVHRYPEFDLDAEVVVRGNRYKIAAEKIFEGVSPVTEKKKSSYVDRFVGYGLSGWNSSIHRLDGDPVDPPEDWYAKVQKQENFYARSRRSSSHTKGQYAWWRDDDDQSFGV